MGDDDKPNLGGDADSQDKPKTTTPPAPPTATSQAPASSLRSVPAPEEDVEDTSGRPPLAEIAQERAAGAHTRTVDTDEED